ncbi:MAG: hypothetical protein EA396_12700 [Anaerolineaceae bacterium]|nr:MAG: hypothetical protein EA396_12700 [Anaerolineaceae bacterium]
MYVQIITIKAPVGEINSIRHFIQNDYLPQMKQVAGFSQAHFLEQMDDRDTAKLIVYWRDQTSAENANGTGLLMDAATSLVAHVPGTRVQRTGYIMHNQLAVENA